MRKCKLEIGVMRPFYGTFSMIILFLSFEWGRKAVDRDRSLRVQQDRVSSVSARKFRFATVKRGTTFRNSSFLIFRAILSDLIMSSSR
jgi:hypothetical protein